MSDLERRPVRPDEHGSCRVEEVAIPANTMGVIALQQEGASSARHRHHAMELIVVVAGHGSAEVCNTTFGLVRGSLLWVFPDQPHWCTEGSPDLEMWIVAFDASLLNRVGGNSPRCAAVGSREQCHAIPWRDLHWLDADFSRLCSARSPDLLNAGLAYCVLGAWEAFTQARRQGTRSPQVERALQLVEKHPELGYQEVAEHVGWSSKRLARTFQREVGVALRSFQNQVRLDRFTELIQAGNTSYLDACFIAGFGSYAHCHRLFTQRMRCSPRDYALRSRSCGGGNAALR